MAKSVINCAGNYSDEVNRMNDRNDDFRQTIIFGFNRAQLAKEVKFKSIFELFDLLKFWTILPLLLTILNWVPPKPLQSE